MPSGPITLYELPPSPNTMKVRIALRYKDVPFQSVVVDPADRAKVLEISGQPLTPVLVHGDTVIYDSSAILRYLDANVKQGPRLFSANRDAMKAIEGWEQFRRQVLGASLGIAFGQFFSGKVDAEAMERANNQMDEATARIETRLAEGDWLVGDTMTAADILCATVVYYWCVPESAAPAGSIAAYFRQHLALPPRRERTRDWVKRVMAHHR